ncbi:MAG: hypothetical protein AAF654_12615 [Myxococcota bacterium]
MGPKISHKDLIEHADLRGLEEARASDALLNADRNGDFHLEHEDLAQIWKHVRRDRQLNGHQERSLMNKIYLAYAQLASPPAASDGVPHQDLLEESGLSELYQSRAATALHQADRNRDMVLQRSELRAALRIVGRDPQLNGNKESYVKNKLVTIFTRLYTPPSPTKSGVLVRGGAR